jgi:crotonobetainyl-CoA:carnitine CoA-transferase CaiB-like acyl-CoA transferase
MTALDGVRILDLTWGMAGPAGILLLAESGADVVKVEPPGGDPYRDYPAYRVWNRSRRSVALDLKSDEGKAKFLELVATADVLAESFSPGVMARLGLDYDTLSEQFPHLIYCSIPA